MDNEIMEDSYQLEVEPILVNVGLWVRLALFLAEIVPCLLAFVDP